MAKIEKYELVKSKLLYECPHCRFELQSKLKEAGKSDSCPSCNGLFEVPGVAHREAYETELAAIDQKKTQGKEAAKEARFQKQEQKAQQNRNKHAAVTAANQADYSNRISQANAAAPLEESTYLHNIDKKLGDIRLMIFIFFFLWIVLPVAFVVLLMSGTLGAILMAR